MEYTQKQVKPLTPQERAESLAMWKRMYEREDDMMLEMLEELIAEKQSRQKAQGSQGTTSTAMMSNTDSRHA